MKNSKIKSFCKINLSLKVIKKLKNGYHNIATLITFCNVHDLILISKKKGLSDKIIFSGRFKDGINSNFNTVTSLFKLLRKNNLLLNNFFKINIKKNIPHGSGLGGGSSNAACLLKYLNKKIKLKLNKKKMIELASQIGFDVPINLEKKNTFLTGNRDEMLRLSKKFNLNLLIVYPNIICSTKKIYEKNTLLNKRNLKTLINLKTNKKLISFLKNEKNDLEQTAIKLYPKIKKVINYIEQQKGCYISRITGSGSACIGIFSNMKNAVYAQKLIKLKYPKYWTATSKTI